MEGFSESCLIQPSHKARPNEQLGQTAQFSWAQKFLNSCKTLVPQLLWDTGPMLTCLTINNFLPICKSSWDFFPYNLCRLSLVFPTCTPEKGSDPVFVASHSLLLFLPQPEQTQCPQLPFKCRCSCPFTYLLQSITDSIHTLLLVLVYK